MSERSARSSWHRRSAIHDVLDYAYDRCAQILQEIDTLEEFVETGHHVLREEAGGQGPMRPTEQPSRRPRSSHLTVVG